MECLHTKNFDFFVEELIAVCLVAKVNVAVFTEEASVLTYAGGFFEADGAVTCSKLRPNRFGRTRSHFERLITTTELQQIVHDNNRAAEDAMLADDAQDHLLWKTPLRIRSCSFPGSCGRCMPPSRF